MPNCGGNDPTLGADPLPQLGIGTDTMPQDRHDRYIGFPAVTIPHAPQSRSGRAGHLRSFEKSSFIETVR
jgi:hypothetical protein